jgi:MFS family permease
MSPENFLDYGWRIPFIASSLLVVVGFYIRLKITETPAFEKANWSKKKIPLMTIIKSYKTIDFGTFASPPFGFT